MDSSRQAACMGSSTSSSNGIHLLRSSDANTSSFWLSLLFIRPPLRVKVTCTTYMTCTTTPGPCFQLFLLFGCWVILVPDIASPQDFRTVRAQRHALLHSCHVIVAGEPMDLAADRVRKRKRPPFTVALQGEPKRSIYSPNLLGL